MKLRVDFSCDQRIGAFGKAHMNRRKTIEGDPQHTEDRMSMLLHAASLGADGNALTLKVGDGFER